MVAQALFENLNWWSIYDFSRTAVLNTSHGQTYFKFECPSAKLLPVGLCSTFDFYQLLILCLYDDVLSLASILPHIVEQSVCLPNPSQSCTYTVRLTQDSVLKITEAIQQGYQVSLLGQKKTHQRTFWQDFPETWKQIFLTEKQMAFITCGNTHCNFIYLFTYFKI